MTQFSELSGKAALITGASRGIGEATARVLANAGVAVALTARTTAAIEAVAEEIRAAGGHAIAIGCDVADYGAVEAATTQTREAFGRLDILVNNAGVIDPVAHLGYSDPAAWGQVIDINVKGVYHGARAVLPGMVDAGGGVIINISSGAATSAIEGWSHYCASKAAVLMITRMLEKEYGDKGIRAIGLSPGTVATDMQRVIKKSGINPVSQLAWEAHIPPDWVARAIAWLATADAAEFAGGDVSLRQEDIRRRAGLID